MALKIVFNKTRKQTTKTEKPNENENAQKTQANAMAKANAKTTFMCKIQNRRGFEFALLVNSFYKQARRIFHFSMVINA